MVLWLQTIMQSIASLLISTSAPTKPNPDWILLGNWQKQGKLLVLAAESTTAAEHCRTHPDDHLTTPILIQGGHDIFLDGVRVHSTVDRDFSISGNFYNTARVPCALLSGGKTVRWEAFTQTHSFANLNYFPNFDNHPVGMFLRQPANVFAAGTLFGLCFVCFLVFHGKVDSRVINALIATCLFYAFTFSTYVPSAFLIERPQIQLQRWSDISLWFGFITIGRLFHLLGYASKRTQYVVWFTSFAGIVLVFCSGTLDQSQVGQNLPLFTCYLFFFHMLRNTKLLRHASSFSKRREIFKFISLIILIISGTNDLLQTQLGIDSEPFYPFGVLSAVILLALAVNERVTETYEERDFLRQNLEKEVERKTKDLQQKTEELATTLDTLKTTQADLVQSAKLASLGTLSAGIAHEINNALNYVNGSVDPLANILKKEQITEMDRGKATRLIKLMKEGLDLTFGIIVNLKRQTSGSSTQIENIPLKELLEGAVLLLKHKLSEIEVRIDVSPEVRVEASQVGLSQIFMNLLGNAADAIQDGIVKKTCSEKRIVITADTEDSDLVVHIVDSGPGIPGGVRDRIFDPFFTTKEVGKGTGLGLHIVLSEMKKYGGKVELAPPTSGGAHFRLIFPNKKRVPSGSQVGAA